MIIQIMTHMMKKQTTTILITILNIISISNWYFKGGENPTLQEEEENMDNSIKSLEWEENTEQAI